MLRRDVRCWCGLVAVVALFQLAGCQSSMERSTEQAAGAVEFSPAVDGSPYGVCAHISRGGEHQIAVKEMAAMNAAGINWVRTDFDWAGVEKKEGEWDFASLDETVEWARQANINILPILDYDVAWARPVQQHLDKWSTYVRTVVTRYKDRLRYWEVWNEQNIGGFKKNSNGAKDYVLLLEATYKTVKAIDPNLTVVYGGTAGIPWDFLEESYKAGAKNFFDVMNIHPYRYPSRPETGKLYEDICKLRELMDTYGDSGKPIWITEFGWPTHCPPVVVGEFLNGIFEAGVKSIRGDKPVSSVAILSDPDYRFTFEPEMLETARVMAGKRAFVEITLAGLAALDPAVVQVLVMPPEEGFPADYFDALESFVRRGGIVVFWAGVPLCYQYKKGADGTWNQSDADESFRTRLHIGWEAWWTRKDVVPESTKQLEVPAEVGGMIKLPKTPMEATRFLTDSALKPGDRMIPLIHALHKDYKGVPVAAYAFDSDLKGGVIVMTNRQIGNNVTPDRQGLILPRAYLTAFQAGVQRVFWYEFQAPEHDLFYNEDHFGMVHNDISPKPAYTAMQALTRARPAGSAMATGVWRSGAIYHPRWKRPDGRTGWALWTPQGESKCALTVRGAIDEAFDHLGRPVALQPNGGALAITLTESVLYIIGPEDLVVPATAE